MSDRAERRNSEGAAAQTVAQLYLEAEHSHVPRVVVRWRSNGVWSETPSWRFYRQVIRIGLFLRDRLGVAPGDCVVVASALSGERVVAEWAAMTVGATVVAVDLELPDEALAVLLQKVAPKAAFVAGARECERLLKPGAGPSAEKVIVFAASAPPASARSWTEALDLGGTLDTAERAQTFRAQAAALPAGTPAFGYRERVNGAPFTRVTHAQVVQRLRSFWARVPPGDGERAYVAGGGDGSSPLCLPLWAFVADGRTSTTLGTRGRELEELDEWRPHLHVLAAGQGALRRGVSQARAGGLRPSGKGTSRSVAAPAKRGLVTLVGRLFPRGADELARDSLREILTFEGVQVKG